MYEANNTREYFSHAAMIASFTKFVSPYCSKKPQFWARLSVISCKEDQTEDAFCNKPSACAVWSAWIRSKTWDRDTSQVRFAAAPYKSSNISVTHSKAEITTTGIRHSSTVCCILWRASSFISRDHMIAPPNLCTTISFIHPKKLKNLTIFLL